MSPVDIESHGACDLRPPELELDACASFLLRHGLQLTALELAQETQDLYGEMPLCATLQTFLAQLPSKALACADLANGSSCSEAVGAPGPLPMGAAECTSRPWDERTLILEYELRICKEDLAQAEEQCRALQKELDKSKAVAVELQPLGDNAGPSTFGSAGDSSGQDASIPQEPQPSCILQGCSLADTLPLQYGEHRDALVEIVLGVSEIVPFLPPGKKILMAPVLTRCALLQPKLLGSSVACLLPQLIPAGRSNGKIADVPQASMRRDVIRCEVELALQLDHFAVEVLPVLLRDDGSRHEMRRILIAELCGVLGVVTLTACLQDGGDHREASIAASIFAALRALLRDSAPGVRAMAATALARCISALGSCDASAFSGLDEDIQRLCLDSSVEVLSRCRRSVWPRIASLPRKVRRPAADGCPAAADGSPLTALGLVVDCGQKRLIFPALHSARMCAHSLARHTITLSERGLWVLRLRLFLELLLTCLPTLMNALAAALTETEDVSTVLDSSPRPESAALLLGDLNQWEGEWAPLEGASAKQAAAEDDELDSWLHARLARLVHKAGAPDEHCCNEAPAEQHPPSGGWLTDDTTEQLRAFLLAHVTPQGFLPFEPTWNDGSPAVVRLAPSEDEVSNSPTDLPLDVHSFLQDSPSEECQLDKADANAVLGNDSTEMEPARELKKQVAADNNAELASPVLEVKEIPSSSQDNETPEFNLAKEPNETPEFNLAKEPQKEVTAANREGSDVQVVDRKFTVSSDPLGVSRGPEPDGDLQISMVSKVQVNGAEEHMEARKSLSMEVRKNSSAVVEHAAGISPGGDDISLSEARRRAQMFIRDSDSSDSDNCLGRFEASDSDDEGGTLVSEASAGNQQENQAAWASAGLTGPVAAEVDPLNEWLRPSGVAALTQAATWWESGRNLVGNLMEDAMLPQFPEEEEDDAPPDPGEAKDYLDGGDQLSGAHSSLSRKNHSSIVSVSSIGEEVGRKVSELSSEDIHAFLENAMHSDETPDHGYEVSTAPDAEAWLSGNTADDDSGTPRSLANAVARSVLASAAVPMPSPPPLAVPIAAAAAGALVEDLCPPLTFCTNSWVAAVVEIAGLLDLCDAENTPVLDALCHTLTCLSQLLGKDFKQAVIERQLTEALAPFLARLQSSSGMRNRKESLETTRAVKILPVYCRVVVSTWPPEQAVDWLIRVTLEPGLSKPASVHRRVYSASSAQAGATDRASRGEKDDWTVQRWLWCELAGQDEVHAAMLEHAIWPAIGGELGPGARTAAACALDALIEVMKPAALLRHVLPAVFALSDSSTEADPAAEAATQALVPLASAWARLDELGFEAEERITVHFHDVTEHGGPGLARAGAQQLRRLAALPGVSRNVIVSVFSAAMRLADFEAYATCSGVQVALAQTLMALLGRSELTSQPVGVEALRATASVVCMREPLLEPAHADLNATLCRKIAKLQWP